MATLKFQNIDKVYDNNVQAVFDFNLEIKDKEFIVFVGPSGCGKSTTLRMVAGLEEITKGKLYVNDVLMNDVEPMNRGIAMVFQNYALYPTMTVFNNMAFSLKMRKFPLKVTDEAGNPVIVIDRALIKKKKMLIKQAYEEIKEIELTEKARQYVIKKDARTTGIEPDPQSLETPQEVINSIADIQTRIENLRQDIEQLESTPSAEKIVMVHMKKAEIKERVYAAAEILGLTDYLNRKPAALSGGQRQRVALGRAIVRKPDVFLMDEPLSNLDAKLRVQTRSEIIKIHKEVGATTIYVTHDQTEAMTMADRIVVMKGGYIQQIATPKEVYEHPANIFVATFIGSPSMNLLDATYDGKAVSIGNEFTYKTGADFKKEHDNFYAELKKTSEQIIDEASADLNTLRLLGEKQNKNAIEQREKIIEFNTNNVSFADSSLANPEHAIKVGIRPEDIYLVGDSNNRNPSKPITVDVKMVELLGQELIVYSELEGQKLVLKIPSYNDIKEGDKIKICLNLDKLHLFDPSSTKRL